MTQFVVRGEVVPFGSGQHNIRVQNAKELREFWTRERIDTLLDWAGEPPLVTISAQSFVSRCQPGDEVEYVIEAFDRADGRRIRGVDLRIVRPAQR